jgi:hypothetical protein
MFRSMPDIEPAPDVVEPADLIPLSHIELDLDAPVESWPSFLAARDIEVTLDDIGRMSIARFDARRLLTEKRDREAEQARRRKLVEAQAVADDQIRRSQIWQGVPAADLPPGMSASSVMLAASKDAQPRRQSVLQHALANSGELVFHPITPDEE